MNDLLLNIDTLIVRPAIAIDGVRYELFSPDELSILQSHRFAAWGRRIDLLTAIDDASDATLAELDRLYGMVARAAMIDVPDALFAQLTGAQLISVVDVFTALLLRRTLGVAGAMQTATGMDQWTGARSFPSSSASTAGGPTGGWLKRLLRWFGLI